MRSAKRFITVLALLVLCVCLMAVSVYAAEEVASGTCGDDLTWVLDDEGTLTISGTGEMEDYYLEEGGYYPPWRAYKSSITEVNIEEGVASIGDFAFYNCGNLSKVFISDGGVDEIGYLAFADCKSLTSAKLPAGLNRIDYGAFSGCAALTQIEIPVLVEQIEMHAFMGTGLKNLFLPEKIKNIGSEAFWGCEDLTAVTIPASLKGIENNAFEYCDALKDVYYEGSEAEWTGITIGYGNNCLYNAAIHYNYVKPLDTPVISKFENTAKGIKITWNAVNGAAKYRVFAKTSKGWLNIGTTAGNSLVYNGAKSGLTYTFTVRCLNAEGTAFTSDYNTTGWKQTYVAQPVISKFQNTAGGIKISWNAVAGAGKYRVYAKTSKGWLNIGTTSGTSLVYTGAKSGLTYTFTVRALNSAGTAFVSSFNTTGWRYTYIAQPTVTKFENVANGIKITWGKVNGAAAYRVFAKTSKGWVAVGTTTGNSFVWTGAKSGLTYTFTVRCLNAKGTAYTSSYNTVGWRQKYVAQPTVTKLTNTTNGINITWGKVSGAERYRVYVKTASGWSCIGHTTGNSFTWTGAKKGVTYTFTIRCVNAANNAFTSSCNATGWSIMRT